MELAGKVGPQTLQDGASSPVRLSRSGAVSVADVQARFYEAVARGKVWGVANQAGITTQAGLSATTPALTLFNPKGSGVNGVIWFAGANNSVAFAAAALIWLGANTDIAAADVTGTATTAHRNLLLGNGSQPAIRPLLAATLPAAPIAIASIGVGLTGAITTLPVVPTVGRWFDGSLVLAPGSAISFQTSAASGATGFFGEFVWEEVSL